MASIFVCRAAGASQRIHNESEDVLRKLVRKFEDRIRLVRTRYRLDVLGDRFSVSESVRTPPAAFSEALDDIAVEVGIAMRKRGIRLVDLQKRMNISAKRANAISRWLRGVDHPIGVHGAIRVAEALDIPVRVLVGQEAVL